jgi:putative ABC transport system permease protein
VVLAAAGGAVGVGLAAAGVRALAAASPPDLPRIASIAIDGRVLAFALGITLLTALLFGLAPALQQSRVDLRGALGSGTRSVGGGALGRLRSVLVASEIALALVLLIGAGLLGRSFLRLLANDLGFAVENRAAVQLFLWDRAPTAEQRIVRAREYEATLRATPGVEAVGIVSALPFHPSQIDTESGLVIAGRPETEVRPGRVQTTVASPDYFAVMQIPLRAGRAFTAADRAGAPAVAIVNETLARRYFAGADPIGQVVTVGVMGRPIAREIVAVVGDVRPTALDADPRAELFVPYEQSGTGSITFVVRTAGPAAALLPRLRERVWSVDPAQAIYHSATVDQLIADTLRERRFHLVLIGSLSAVALVLSIIGIYGLIRFATQRRQAEIGVRMALGARRGDVTWMIVREALRFAVPGVALGIAASLVLTRFLRSMLYGVTPADPATFAQLAALMLAIAAASASVPAWRAASTDPMRVLRRE